MRTIFDPVRDVPLVRGVLAILLGLGLLHLARVMYRRPYPPADWRERLDRTAYWFGRVVGVAILVLGVVALGLELFLLCAG
jgi:hypothetical protein